MSLTIYSLSPPHTPYLLDIRHSLARNMAANPQFLKFVDDNQDHLIDRLAQAVAIPSYVPDLPVSGEDLAP